MKKLARLVSITALGACAVLASTAPWAADAPKKNWTAPARKIYAQKALDETMARPEVAQYYLAWRPAWTGQRVHHVAGSYPERIGNPDDPDDIDVSKKGITILDPRWHRTNDTTKKFVVLMRCATTPERMSAWSSTRSRTRRIQYQCDGEGVFGQGHGFARQPGQTDSDLQGAVRSSQVTKGGPMNQRLQLAACLTALSALSHRPRSRSSTRSPNII